MKRRRTALKGVTTTSVPADGTPCRQQTCAGTDSPLFLLRPVAQGTQLVAKHSGKCVAVAPGNPKGAALIEVPCAEDPAQTWQVQRSIYKIERDRSLTDEVAGGACYLVANLHQAAALAGVVPCAFVARTCQ